MCEYIVSFPKDSAFPDPDTVANFLARLRRVVFVMVIVALNNLALFADFGSFGPQGLVLTDTEFLTWRMCHVADFCQRR